VRTFWLNFHLGYACRHSGVCCTSGWPIPVEHDRVIPIQSLAARADDSWMVPATNAPADVAGTLAVRANGECTFFRIPTSSVALSGGAAPAVAGCAVHPARPSSCSHFPFVCLIDARGVHVTLSHYCPTAASMLFDDVGPIAIVEGPPPVRGLALPEGLDAREALPPLASPDRLMSFEDLTTWERATAAAPWPDAAHQPLRSELFERARRAVPSSLDWPAAPDGLERVWEELVHPSWPDFAPVLSRYRATKVFASWALYLDDGIAAVKRSADLALAVLAVEAARQCAADGAALDAARLKEAIRRTDLLLVHYADPHLLL